MNKNAPILITVIAFAGIFLLSSMLSSPKEYHVDAQLMKMNVLYVAVDNPIVINIPGVPPGDIRPSTIGASIRYTLTPGQFIITLNQPGPVTLNICVAGPDSANIIQTITYRAKKIPDPVTYVNDIREDGVVLKENLQNLTGIFTRMENFDFDCAFQPISYSMSVIENGVWKEYKALGAALTPEMKTALSKAEENDKIIFHNVKVKGPAGDIRNVNSVTITVK